MTAISSQHPAVRQQKNCVMFFPEKLKNAPVLFNSLEASAAAHVSMAMGHTGAVAVGTMAFLFAPNAAIFTCACYLYLLKYVSATTSSAEIPTGKLKHGKMDIWRGGFRARDP